MHSSGVIHSDIKPENIFLKDVGGREVLKFGDFGMAKFGFGSEILASKIVGGSPAYQPPEIRDGTSKPSPSTDIYSLGAQSGNSPRLIFQTASQTSNSQNSMLMSAFKKQ